MTFVWDVFTLVFAGICFYLSKNARIAYQQRRALYDLNPGAEIPGYAPLSTYVIQLWVWRILFAISLVLVFYNYRGRL